MSPTIQGIVVGFVVLVALFQTLQLLRPYDQRLPLLRRGFWTDVAYWAFTPLVTRAITRVSVIVVIIPFALLVYGKVDEQLLRNGFGPASRLPLWVQAVCILTLGDFIGYWMHRAFHGARLWRFHAVHHSSVDLDWLSSVRLHPVNDALMRVTGTLPILALGFAPLAVVGNRTGAHAHGDLGACQPGLGLGAFSQRDRFTALSSLAPHRRAECPR